MVQPGTADVLVGYQACFYLPFLPKADIRKAVIATNAAMKQAS
jgi:hypothetical protein